VCTRPCCCVHQGVLLAEQLMMCRCTARADYATRESTYKRVEAIEALTLEGRPTAAECWPCGQQWPLNATSGTTA
jgi:hypothetical protein